MAKARTNRRDVLKTLGAGSVSLAVPGVLSSSDVEAGSLQPAGRRRPNVILIMTDDQGYGDLSCHGNPVLETPHLDRLHGESVRLTDFHVDPTCSPTRASLLTGRYSSRTGVWHTIMGRSQLHEEETTMADVFRDNGYRTGIFGKWHLGDNYPFRPQDRGFDDSVVIGGGAIGNNPDYWGNDYFDDTYRHNGQWQKYEGYCTDVFFDQAMSFMRGGGDRPFFVYLPTNTPHWPPRVAEEYTAPYEGRVPERVAAHFGMVANIDANVGRLMTFLEETGLEEDTIVIFLTDNGTAFGVEYDEDREITAGFNDGMRGRKGSIYDGGHRVPFFVRWPGGGIGGGRDAAPLTAHIDVLPTLMDLCGLESSRQLDMDGTSLEPLLRQADPEWPDRTLCVHSQRVDHPIKWRQSAVMTDRWRLINGSELYDMAADPGQSTDVSSRHPDRVETMSEEYERWWDHVSGRFDDYTAVVLGTPHENPSTLTSHDIHGKVGWAHGHVRRVAPNHGFWVVEIAREGTYRFQVRRWPEESGLAILDTPEDAEELDVTQARLRIAAFDETRLLREGDRSIDFEVDLTEGRTRLDAWLVDGKSNGQVSTAFYVDVKRL